LEPLGYSCVRAARVLIGYGYGAHRIALWVVAAERPVQADDRSGLHICFAAPSAAVDGFHAAAIYALEGGITARQVSGRYIAPITTLRSSSIRTAIASRHITV